MVIFCIMSAAITVLSLSLQLISLEPLSPTTLAPQQPLQEPGGRTSGNLLREKNLFGAGDKAVRFKYIYYGIWIKRKTVGFIQTLDLIFEN